MTLDTIILQLAAPFCSEAILQLQGGSLDVALLSIFAAGFPEDAAPPRGASTSDADGATAVTLVLAGNRGVGTGEEGGSGDGNGSLEEVELHVLVWQLDP